MNKEEFVKTLKECDVSEEFFESWWNGWSKDPLVSKFKPSKELVFIFAKKNVEKGCTSAPW